MPYLYIIGFVSDKPRFCSHFGSTTRFVALGKLFQIYFKLLCLMEVFSMYHKMHRSQMYNSIQFYICIQLHDHISALPAKHDPHSNLALLINFVFQNSCRWVHTVYALLCVFFYSMKCFSNPYVVFISLKVCSF